MQVSQEYQAAGTRWLNNAEIYKLVSRRKSWNVKVCNNFVHYSKGLATSSMEIHKGHPSTSSHTSLKFHHTLQGFCC